jgi:hypothetical protein
MLTPILRKFSKGRKRTQEGWCYCIKETKSINFLESYCIFLELEAHGLLSDDMGVKAPH